MFGFHHDGIKKWKEMQSQRKQVEEEIHFPSDCCKICHKKLKFMELDKSY